MSIWLLGTKLPSSNKISSVEFLDKAQENSPSEGDSIVINLTEGSAFPTCNATDEIESIALVVTNNNNTISYDVQICFSNTFNTLDTTNHVNTADMQADPNSCNNSPHNFQNTYKAIQLQTVKLLTTELMRLVPYQYLLKIEINYFIYLINN